MTSIEQLRNAKCSHMIMVYRGVCDAPFDELIDENLIVIKKKIQAVTDLIDRQMKKEEEIYQALQAATGIEIRKPKDT